MEEEIKNVLRAICCAGSDEENTPEMLAEQVEEALQDILKAINK